MVLANRAVSRSEYEASWVNYIYYGADRNELSKIMDWFFARVALFDQTNL